MLKPMKPLSSRSLRAVVPAVYVLMCSLPLLAISVCMVHFNLLREPLALLSIAGYLACSLTGYLFLHKVVNRVIALSTVASPIDTNIGGDANGNELNRLAMTFSDLIVRLERTTAHLDKRMQELKSIGEITDLTARTSDMKLLFESVLEKTMATLGASRGIILAVSRDGTTLKPDVMRGSPDLIDEDVCLPVDDTIVGRPVRERRVFVSVEPLLEKHYNPEVDSGFADGPLFALPITARGAVVGVLVLSRGKYAPAFEELEIQYATTALSQAAFAFNNARLVQELRSTCRELKHARDKVIATERVAAINQTVVTLSDKINSPLTVIKGHIEIMRRLLHHDEAGVRRSIDMIDTSVERCIDIMTRLSKIHDHVPISEYPGGDTTMIDIDHCGVSAHDQPVRRYTTSRDQSGDMTG